MKLSRRPSSKTSSNSANRGPKKPGGYQGSNPRSKVASRRPDPFRNRSKDFYKQEKERKASITGVTTTLGKKTFTPLAPIKPIFKTPTKKQASTQQDIEAHENVYPMRINRYLALKNYSTRRGADELIEKRKVFINGKLAMLGSKVQETDNVEVRYSGILKPYVYYAYNKPQGTITHSPQHGEQDIRAQMIAINRTIRAQQSKHKMSEEIPRVFPIGRLDKDSSGLIILTNDGRITDKLLNPAFEHEKEYIVTTVNKIRDSFKDNMEQGVEIEGYKTKPCWIKIINENTFRITLTEGKKHQIRRMCEAMHNQVRDLTRTRVMNVQLGKMLENSIRKIEGKELEEFLNSLGINAPTVNEVADFKANK